MAFSSGRTYLAIPGPSVAPDRVLNAMHQAAPNIYEGDIVAVTPAGRTAGGVEVYLNSFLASAKGFPS